MADILGRETAPTFERSILMQKNLGNLIDNLANLIKVKTLVTFAVVWVFAKLALDGSITADNVMVVVSMVVAFYFGTQSEKRGGSQ